MAIKYTEEQLNSVDKSMLIQMFLNQQEQLEKVSADSFLIIKQIQAIYREYSGSVVKTKIQAFYNEPISVAELGRCPR